MLAPGSGQSIVSARTSALKGLKKASLLQHETLTDVRFGSLATDSVAAGHVCSTPDNGHQS
jgi:hypothetical protein